MRSEPLRVIDAFPFFNEIGTRPPSLPFHPHIAISTIRNYTKSAKNWWGEFLENPGNRDQEA